MAQSRRVERVASLIRREMSLLLMNGIRDERVNHGMVSVTAVEVSGDLQHCKIFVSVFGEESEKKDVLAGLQSANSFIRAELGRKIKLRRTPEVVFQLDRGLEKGSSVLNLLSTIEKKRKINTKSIKEDL